ncbi:MaoC/PaaZ C-terminal domain-containing protein [Nocardia sp. NPDC003963]
MKIMDWAGYPLGTRVVQYSEDDAILYALAVGARADEIPLVFERDLRVLPTFALTLGLWVADSAAEAGAFVPAQALHGAQSLVMHGSLPRATVFEVAGYIESVRDTGRSAILDIVAESEYFSATYSIILPGAGGFSSTERRPASADRHTGELRSAVSVNVPPDRAALYRLTGDRHLIHIDPAAARAAGFDRPILHGLCTLGSAAKALAEPLERQPWELRAIEARFVAPVYPGSVLEIGLGDGTDGQSPAGTSFGVTVADRRVLSDGRVRFG